MKIMHTGADVKMKRLEISGFLSGTTCTPNVNELCIWTFDTDSWVSISIAEDLIHKLTGSTVYVSYYISDIPMDDAVDAQENFLADYYEVRQGEFSGVYKPIVYGEITGYCHTEESMMIGGHDLHKELSSFIGKWIVLIVDYN
ncbi:hypothetical protein N9043_00320 [bacterium]|nr:hypothetical protein [bacterium]